MKTIMKKNKQETIKIGQKVSFVCSPYGRGKPFEVTGIIQELKETTFGGKKRSLGALIIVSSKKYSRIYNGRKRALINVDNLKAIL